MLSTWSEHCIATARPIKKNYSQRNAFVVDVKKEARNTSSTPFNILYIFLHVHTDVI